MSILKKTWLVVKFFSITPATWPSSFVKALMKGWCRGMMMT
jgi:hypothetical protein